MMPMVWPDAVYARLIKGRQVVLSRKIFGSQCIKSAGAVGHRPLRNHPVRGARVSGMPKDTRLRCGTKTVEGRDALHERRKRCGNLQLSCIGVLRCTVDGVLVDLSVKCGTQGSCGTGELDELPAFREPRDIESMRREPPGGSCKIRIVRPKLLAELLGSEPLMIAGRSERVSGLQELLQCSLPIRRTIEQEKHAARGKGVGDGPAIVPHPRQRVQATTQRDETRFVDGLRYQRRWLVLRGEGKRKNARNEGNQSF